MNFAHHDKAPDKLEVSNAKKPEPTMPDTYPSQHFDAKSKQLHDMHDRAGKALASRQREPVSEYEGTFWRSPSEPKPISPTYSEISDSFESPDRIEHCIDVLLSTPMSPISTQFKGPDGWPLGFEVAKHDYSRGRLSTPVLQKEELPNPLAVCKRKQQTPRFGGNGNQERYETASCESVSPTQHSDDQHQQMGGCLEPLAFKNQQSPVPSQSYGKEQDDMNSVSLKALASQQQIYTHPQQQIECQPQHSGVDLDTPESQVRSGKENDFDNVYIPTLSARRYGDDQTSRANASSELHPALANGKLPIGLALENACLQPSIFQFHSEEHNGSHNQRDDTDLIEKGRPQTALSGLAPHKQAEYEETHHVESRSNALPNALDEECGSARSLGAYENTSGEIIDSGIGCQKTFEDRENDTLQGIDLQTSRDSEADTDSDFFVWTASGPLEAILEESEDSFTSTLTLDQGQPQHFALGPAEPLDLHRSSWVDESCDSMPTFQESQINMSTLSLRSPRVLPTLKLAIDPSSTPQPELTGPSTHRPIGMKSSEPSLSAATLAELKDPTRKKGRLSAAALVEMRKTAKAQSHFQTGPNSPKDQSQADIHPLLRSKSFSRPSSDPSKVVSDSPLRYVFVDDDSDHHEAEETDSQSTTKPHSSLRPESPDSKSYVKHESMTEHPSQLGKMKEDILRRYSYNDDDTEAEFAETFAPQKSTVRFSNHTTPVPSPENAAPPTSSLPRTNDTSALVLASPGEMEPFILQPSTSPPMTGYYPKMAFGSPAEYNSWASTPHRHKQGNCSSTALSAAALPTSTYNSWASTPHRHQQGNCSSTPSSAAALPTSTYNSWASTPHRHPQGNCSSTPSSAATLPTSTVPTPDTSFHGCSPTSRGTTMTPSSSFGQFASTLPSSRGIPMTPSSSFGQLAGNLPNSRAMPMTPSSSFGQLAGNLPNSRAMPMTPSSSFGNFPSNRTQRRSISSSSMFARYNKARYPDLQTAAVTDTILSSKEPAEKDQAREVTNDPFTSTGDDSTSFSLNLKAPSKEDLADTLNVNTPQFNTPTKRSSGRFSLHRRSLSTSERPKTNEGLERAVSTMIFKPHRNRLHKRSHSISGSIDTTTKLDSSSIGNRRSLSIATSTTTEQKWELAPPPTPLALRDEFSNRYRPDPLEADDHYSSRKDAAQGTKQGWKKVFGRK